MPAIKTFVYSTSNADNILDSVIADLSSTTNSILESLDEIEVLKWYGVKQLESGNYARIKKAIEIL